MLEPGKDFQNIINQYQVQEVNNVEELEKAVSAFRLCKNYTEMQNVFNNVKSILGRLCFRDIEYLNWRKSWKAS